MAGKPVNFNAPPASLGIFRGSAFWLKCRIRHLRHTHATHMLASGIHPKIAQERLGHSSIAITSDLYSYVLPGMQENAATQVDAVLQAALDKGNGSQSGSK